MIALEIVDAIEEKGRFLTSSHGCWKRISREKACSKVKKAINDKVASLKKKSLPVNNTANALGSNAAGRLGISTTVSLSSRSESSATESLNSQGITCSVSTDTSAPILNTDSQCFFDIDVWTSGCEDKSCTDDWPGQDFF